MSSGLKRVVVTGLGVLSPVGSSVESFWNSLLSGQSGIGKITRFDAGAYTTQIAGEVKNFDPSQHLDRKSVV